MPPRARKTVAPTPTDGADTTPDAPESPIGGVVDAAPGVEADPPEVFVPAQDWDPDQSEAPDDVPLSPAAQAVAALIEPPSITYRWTSANGDGSAPCRLCAPAGPPAGAGSFGCGHGQWVLVADEAP